MRLRPVSFVVLLILLIGTLTAAYAQPAPPAPMSAAAPNLSVVRFAQFNASVNRNTAGQLLTDLATPDSQQIRNVAEIIQRVNPDVLLINEFDYYEDFAATALFQQNYLSVSQNGAPPINFPYVYVAPSNTGIASGFDLDNNGVVVTTPGAPGYGNDAFGFGNFPGQFGMALFSKYPIDTARVRTFQNFLWKDMPGALLPINPATGESWYSPEELEVFRLSSKSHWDVPVLVGSERIHVLASHPTPPVFDGPEDRNGTRNHDEIRFWADYITPSLGDYIYDDTGVYGSLPAGARFVIMGDQNADPNDGDSVDQAIQQLLANPNVNTTITPASLGGPQQAALQGGANAVHISDPAFDTADFADTAPGNLRADYVLPSQGLRMLDAGVFWPLNTDPLFRLVGVFNPALPGGFPSSDHRLVWVDVDVAPTVPFKAETRSIYDLDADDAPDGARLGDADDPAIWVNPQDPARSLVISVLKDGGLDVYDLNGNLVQTIASEPGKRRLRYNNVDLQYNFPLGGKLVDLVAVTDRRNDLMVFFKVNPATLQLENVTDPAMGRVFTAGSSADLSAQKTAYGIALYRTPADVFYAFVTQRNSNRVDQLRLSDTGAGQVGWQRVRTLIFPLVDDDPEESQVEGMVVDQELGLLYAGQENLGIWKFDAAANGSTEGTLIHAVYPDGDTLHADVEGLTIYYGRDGAGYLLASSQGDSSFAVYSRLGANDYLGSFRVGVDGEGVEFSDGADVINVPLGPHFPHGLLVVHDGSNEPALLVEDDGELENVNTNFKFVAWEEVAAAFPTPLTIDTTSYNPRRERLAPVLDDFNRSNGSLRAPNGAWYGAQGLNGYRIVNGQVDVGSGGPLYWFPHFGANQAAFLTLTALDPNASRQSLLLKVQGLNWRTGSIAVNYQDGAVQVTTYTLPAGARTVGSFRANVRPGDQLGAQALGDGSVRVFVNGVEIGRASAGDFFAGKSGRIGLWFADAGYAAFDDFGGGAIAP